MGLFSKGIFVLCMLKIFPADHGGYLISICYPLRQSIWPLFTLMMIWPLRRQTLSVSPHGDHRNALRNGNATCHVMWDQILSSFQTLIA